MMFQPGSTPMRIQQEIRRIQFQKSAKINQLLPDRGERDSSLTVPFEDEPRPVQFEDARPKIEDLHERVAHNI
jgi:hypothetical protein